MNSSRQQVEVAIVGAGSAGISALRQVRQSTGDYVLIDRGPLGTTCARVGCMPSKVLIQVARDFHRRFQMAEEGITGVGLLECDMHAILKHVRDLRDRFANGMAETTRELAGDRLLVGEARLLDAHRIHVGQREIEADRIVLATGSQPVVPGKWEKFKGRIFTSENLFEQETLPRRMAVVGLGAIGLELGQALSRLGIETSGFDIHGTIGGLTDPVVNAALCNAIESRFPLYLGVAAEVREEGGGLTVRAGKTAVCVDGLLLAMGASPNLARLGLENLGVELDERGIPPYDRHTGRIGDLPVYIAGDANGNRAVLHEALDEGFMAGRNALRDDPQCARRRVPLRIVFSDPEAVVVGQGFANLEEGSFVTGKVDYEEQSRAIIEGRNHGCLHVYADPADGRLLGAEAAAPDAAHLGHLLALAIQQGMAVADVLEMPFYHPTLTESLRSALRDAAAQCAAPPDPAGLPLGECSPEKPLA